MKGKKTQVAVASQGTGAPGFISFSYTFSASTYREVHRRNHKYYPGLSAHGLLHLQQIVVDEDPPVVGVLALVEVTLLEGQHQCWRGLGEQDRSSWRKPALD